MRAYYFSFYLKKWDVWHLEIGSWAGSLFRWKVYFGWKAPSPFSLVEVFLFHKSGLELRLLNMLLGQKQQQQGTASSDSSPPPQQSPEFPLTCRLPPLWFPLLIDEFCRKGLRLSFSPGYRVPARRKGGGLWPFAPSGPIWPGGELWPPHSPFELSQQLNDDIGQLHE